MLSAEPLQCAGWGGLVRPWQSSMNKSETFPALWDLGLGPVGQVTKGELCLKPRGWSYSTVGRMRGGGGRGERPLVTGRTSGFPWQPKPSGSHLETGCLRIMPGRLGGGGRQERASGPFGLLWEPSLLALVPLSVGAKLSQASPALGTGVACGLPESVTVRSPEWK